MSISFTPTGRLFARNSSLALAAGLLTATPLCAQAQTLAGAQGGGPIQDIVVTAQKRGVAEAAQAVPIAITAFNSRQLEETHVTTLQSLAIAAPNVSLETNGTTRGVANFTIRGLAVNSSITSLEPTVGTFVDGVYMGTNIGVVLDTFDLESVEILRGPQGTLFGRNVTGGAVLLRTARPGDSFAAKMQASVETGPEYRVAASVSSPITADGRIRAKISGLYNKDEGWFRNNFTGKKHGEAETYMVRPIVVAELSDTVDTTLIYEHGNTKGDGTAYRNLPDDLPYKQVNLNHPGFYKLHWNSVTSETNINVALGDGTITNVAGYRSILQRNLNDVDSTPRVLFELGGYVNQKQFSEELRYAGTFGIWKPTIGLFYFHQHYLSIDQRDLGPPVTVTPASLAGGGKVRQNSYAIFTQNQFDLTDTFNVVLGLRYSYEKKKAHITRTAGDNCVLTTLQCDYDSPGALNDKDHWSSLSPKVGLQWRINPDAQVYASFSQATRSGGYNLRRTNPLDPGKFDQEKMTSWEIGGKGDFLEKKLRVNAAAFYNKVNNIQRDIVVPGTLFGGGGSVQIIANAADTEIYGFEGELLFAPTRNLLLNFSGGYTKNKYTDILLDLNGDGIINNVDYGLRLPRLAPWSYAVGVTYTTDIGAGSGRANINYAYRDAAPLNEGNTLYFQNQKLLTFDVTYTFPGKQVSLSVYGKNMLNHMIGGAGAVLLPPNAATPRGVTFQAMEEGRVIGGQIRVEF